MTDDPCGGNRKGGEGCSCDPPFVTKDPRRVARHAANVLLMSVRGGKVLLLFVALALLVGLAGWLLMPDVVSGHGHLSPRLQHQAALHTP